MQAENQIKKLVKLSSCVNMYIDESRQTSREFRRLWALAFRGLTDIGLDVSWNAKTTVLSVNDNLTATLPVDYIDWVKIGVFNDFGEIATLRVNDQLSNYNDLLESRTSDIGSQMGNDNTYLQYPYWWGGWDDNGYEHYFGSGSSLMQVGECKVDNVNGLILFDKYFQPTQVVIEYVCSPMMDDDYAIDLKAQEALIAWLRWKDIQSLPSNRMVNISEKQMREREYYTQKKLARKRIKPFRVQIAEQFFREAQRLAVKG